MVDVRRQSGSFEPSEPGDAAGWPAGWADGPTGADGQGLRGRFNVLLTEDRPQPGEHWTRQLPRLLQPMGVRAYVARCGTEAVQYARQYAIHAAVIDLATPRDPARAAAGTWLLELFNRLERRPPVVVLRSPAGDRRRDERELLEALRLRAFTVLEKPVDIEQLLAVFQRLMERQYRGQWPSS